jgi:hypothetical protein
VDRLPLVSSCIINVDQDLDEPWPIEVYDHNGKAYNVTMQPGDMVLYESSTVLHGRPFPMKGRHYVSLDDRKVISMIWHDSIITVLLYRQMYSCTSNPSIMRK